MHPGVAISGLVLLLAGTVDSYIEVSGVASGPVMLPCTYDVSSGTSSMCWGRGQCPYSKCSNQLIWTDGNRVTYQRNSGYQLKGRIQEGDVSLTIENAVQNDSGLYCCRVEIPGWFNDQLTTFQLQVRPEIPTSPSTRPTTTTRSTTTRPTTTSPTTTTRPTQALMKTRVSTSIHPIPVHTWTPKPTPTLPPLPPTTEKGTGMTSPTPPDYNDHETSSNESWDNHTEAIPTQSNVIAGVSVTVLVLLILVSALAAVKYIQMKKKMGTQRLVSFHISKTRALKNAVERQPRAEDNIYVIEDNINAIE